MIEFGVDNAAVMMANKAAVKAKLMEVNPSIFVMGCTCHSLHLCATAESFPKAWKSFAEMSLIKEALTEFQQFVNIKPSVMLHPSQTRWLSLQLDFTNYQLEDKLRSAQNILDALNTPVFQVYLLFFSYILDIINKINLEFQSEEPKIHKLLPNNNSKKFFIMQKLNAVDISQILPTNPANFLPEKELYLGAKAEKMLSEIDESPEELKKLKTNVLAFYVELASQIRQRFDFANPLLYFLSNFDAETATIADLETINMEWRLLPNVVDIVQKAKNFSLVQFRSFIFDMKN
ncbi:hypothetical protein HUJ05_008755 [Dendroctonus ponderosae]|nr:hypothetical protein HUJ05_008755 [Dendroctonus ponderosae]